MSDFDAAQVPPHSDRDEMAVLSACILDPSALPKCAAIVTHESFYSEAHRRIFEAIMSLDSNGTAIDTVTVATWLRDHSRLEQVGGFEYLTRIHEDAPAVVNVVTHAETVASKHRVRRLILAAQRIEAEGYAPIADEDAFLDRAEAMVHDIASMRSKLKHPDTMKTALQRAFTKIQEAADRGVHNGYTGTPTGFVALDQATGGLHEGESTVLAARPGMGKTALAMNIACNVAARGLGVVVFSLEMPNEQIATRALCSSARVDVRKARTGAFDRYDMTAIASHVERVGKAEHFYLVDDPCTLLDIRSIVRARHSDMARTGTKLGLVVVDYAQLMEAGGGARSREESVAQNARGIKMLAKEVSAPIVFLSQLNRGVETRNDKRPMLSDLRESGAIEEAADCVIGMYRDDYYNEKSETPGVVELILLKHRHGPTGTVEVGFHAPSVTFQNLERDEREEGWAAQ